MVMPWKPKKESVQTKGFSPCRFAVVFFTPKENFKSAENKGTSEHANTAGFQVPNTNQPRTVKGGRTKEQRDKAFGQGNRNRRRNEAKAKEAEASLAKRE